MNLPDQLIIPLGRLAPAVGITIEVTAEHVAAMAACRERLVISPPDRRPGGDCDPRGHFTVEARPDGLWATQIELTSAGRGLGDNPDAVWLAALFDLGGVNERGGTRGARCHAAMARPGRPPWAPSPETL